MSHQRKLFLVVHYGIHYHSLTGSRNSPTRTSEQPGAEHGLQRRGSPITFHVNDWVGVRSLASFTSSGLWRKSVHSEPAWLSHFCPAGTKVSNDREGKHQFVLTACPGQFAHSNLSFFKSVSYQSTQTSSNIHSALPYLNNESKVHLLVLKVVYENTLAIHILYCVQLQLSTRLFLLSFSEICVRWQSQFSVIFSYPSLCVLQLSK